MIGRQPDGKKQMSQIRHEAKASNLSKNLNHKATFRKKTQKEVCLNRLPTHTGGRGKSRSVTNLALPPFSSERKMCPCSTAVSPPSPAQDIRNHVSLYSLTSTMVCYREPPQSGKELRPQSESWTNSIPEK